MTQFFTKFGTTGGPDVDYPVQVNQSFGAELHMVGEMDPGSNNPLNMDKNLVDSGVNDSTVWGIKTYGGFNGDSLL